MSLETEKAHGQAEVVLEQAVMQEAQTEASQVLADAKARAGQIRQQAQKQMEIEREAILKDACDKAEIIYQQATAAARQEAQMLKLKRREKLLEDVFAKAYALLSSIPQRPDHAQVGHRLVREAVERLAADEVLVHTDGGTWENLDEQTVAELARELNVHLHLSNSLEHGTGVLLETPDGHRYYDNTLETRLTRMKDPLRAPVYHILMGEEDIA